MTSTITSPRAVATSPLPTVPHRTAADRLGAAQTRWNDYVGTTAADDSSPLLASHSLYELAGLDRDRWTVVGVEASLGATAEGVVVYAVDRRLNPDLATASEEVPVTAFHLDSSILVQDFLREAFQRVTLRLVSTLAVAVDRDLLVRTHVAVAPSPSE